MITQDPNPSADATSQAANVTGQYRRLTRLMARLALRIAPTEGQRLFVLTIVIGAACGLAAVSFHLAIDLAAGLAISRAVAAPGYRWIGWTLVVPCIGALAAGILLQYVAPNARGSGLPQVKIAYAQSGGRLRFRDGVAKFVISALQLGTGSSLGREGPTVQICASVASSLGRIARISPQNLRRLLPVGAAAGIAAAFNAPIAAVTFTIEEIVGGLDPTVLSGVIVAAALAAVVERAVLGVNPVFETVHGHGIDGASSLILYAVLGVVAAGVAVAFTESLLRLRLLVRALKRVPSWAQPAMGGLGTGVLAVFAILVLKTGGITGGGYTTLAIALSGGLTAKVMLALCVLKLVATVSSYSTGGAGGIFAPALFIGGMLGGAFGALDIALFHHSTDSIGAFALVGMGAVFAGIIRAPMTSVLIIIEMTSGYSLIVPLMIANMSAYALASRWRPTAIYDALLEQDGVHLRPTVIGDPHALQPTIGPISVERRHFVSFAPNFGTDKLLGRSAQPGRQEVFPVIENDKLVGIITLEDVTFLATDPGLQILVTASDIMRPPASVLESEDLRVAFDLMVANGVRELPVIDASGRVIGLIDEVAIAHAALHARIAKPA